MLMSCITIHCGFGSPACGQPTRCAALCTYYFIVSCGVPQMATRSLIPYRCGFFGRTPSRSWRVQAMAPHLQRCWRTTLCRP